MPDLRGIVEGSSVVFKEYERNHLDKDISQHWIDWDSDWDHGANWQVLPVYASERLLADRYGSSLGWRDTMNVLWRAWSGTWDLVFDCFDLDRVNLVAFSRLCGGETLREHSHENKGNLIFHMGVEIPEGDVGIDTCFGRHHWKKPGEWILFDDNKAHSAWNRTEGDRVIFYIDFRP